MDSLSKNGSLTTLSLATNKLGSGGARLYGENSRLTFCLSSWLTLMLTFRLTFSLT